MKKHKSQTSNLTFPFILSTVLVFLVESLRPPSALLAQEYQIKNDRILAPEVTHFIRPAEPGVDAHGDLSLTIPLLTVPGRNGLDFDIVVHYRSGIQVTQSASWIGLGWSLDLGSITRHPLGGIVDQEQADFAHALPLYGGTIQSQPDVYSVNMNNASTILYSVTSENDPVIPFDPAHSETSGPCTGAYQYSQYYFVPSPWRPWKFCYATSEPVTVDGKSTGIKDVGNRRDFSKFIVTTEDGTRYVFSGANDGTNDLPTLSPAFFPNFGSPNNDFDYVFVSTWRLRAILSSNYSGPDVPDETSMGGWVKIVYKTWDHGTGNPEDVDTIIESTGSQRLVAQVTYPYYVETPTHFAFFQTSKRYDHNLAANIIQMGDYDNDHNYYSRKLDQIVLYKKTEAIGIPMAEPLPGEILDPQSEGNKVMQVSFQYMATGADSLSVYDENNPNSVHKKMLSRLALETITITGVTGSQSGPLPAYKFTYYDEVTLSWLEVSKGRYAPLHEYQDDFGYLEIPVSDPNYSGGPPTRGWMWSLKEITYPEGGRHFFVYANDSLAMRSLSYNTYYVENETYLHVDDFFERFEQGGARVHSITSYDGYNDSTPDVVTYTYGPGRHSAIPEIYFRKLHNHKDLPLYYLGERGQASVTYDWIKQQFPDNSAKKTFYVTGSVSHSSEPQIFYVKSGSHVALLQGNQNWNWGEIDSVHYFNSADTKVKTEIYNWSFRGDLDDPAPIRLADVAPPLRYNYGTAFTDTIEINFTHKELVSLATETHYSSGVVKKTDAYTYNESGTLVKTHSQIGDDGNTRRVLQYLYAYEAANAAPYSNMRINNMRNQLAHQSTRIDVNSKFGYEAIASTWKNSNGIYLPQYQYRWRDPYTNMQIPAFSWHPDSLPDSEEWMLTTQFVSYDQHGNLTRVNDAYGVETTIAWKEAGALIDSIKTRPTSTTSLTTRYGYDPNTFRLTSITDPNGRKTEFKYDPLQRLTEIIAPDKRTVVQNEYYYSRDGNNDVFSTTDPNFIKTHAASAHSFSDAFEYTDAPENHGWVEYLNPNDGVMSTVYDNTLQSRVMRLDVTNGPNNSYGIKYPASGSLGLAHSHVWAKIKNTQTSSSFRVVVWYAGSEYTLAYFLAAGTNSYNASTKTMNIYLGASFASGAWQNLERDLLADFRLTGIPADFEHIQRLIARGEVDFDDVRTDWPVTTLTFADGLGRDIQTLQYDFTGAIKAGTLYDFADRITKVTKPYTSTTRIFDLDAISAANAHYAGRHAYFDGTTPPPDPDPSAFHETRYLADPLNRVSKQGAPGAVFKIGANPEKAVIFTYDTNTASDPVSYTAASLHKQRRQDENGHAVDSYFDTFGNLIATVALPNGLQLKTQHLYDAADNLIRTTDPNGRVTTYDYDTFGLLRRQDAPDASAVEYLYDKKGYLRFVKDGKSASSNPAYFIYYKYDNIGRKIEEGTMSDPTSNFTQPNADNRSFPTSGHAWKVKYHYDTPGYAPSATQRNLKGRLDAIEYKSERFGLSGYLFYSYDDNGNVEWLEQYIPKDAVSDGNAYIITMTNYSYGSGGQLTKIAFNRSFPPGASRDAVYVWYDYDALGRLQKVFANTADVKPATAEAEYSYWPGGQVKRLVLGGNVQGVDYLYNSRDWLTQINHQNLVAGQDPGGDGGGAGVPNADRFGQIIGYNVQNHIAYVSPFSTDYVAQFNGNIAWTIHNTSGNNSPSSLTGWVFKYDAADRLNKANWGHFISNWQETDNRYDLTGITYDAVGNFTHMKRRLSDNTAIDMNYFYKPGSNQLDYVSGLNNQAPGNFTYDQNGNMITDNKKLAPSAQIAYDYRNLPTQVPMPGGSVYFDYDGKGQRVSKNDLIYVYTADGKVLAVYNIDGTHLYWNIWGLDLIGQKFFAQ